MDRCGDDNDDAASIQTVLPSYGTAVSSQPPRLLSPAPSYRTVDPNAPAPARTALWNPLRRIFAGQPQAAPNPSNRHASWPSSHANNQVSQKAPKHTETPGPSLSRAVKLRQTDQVSYILERFGCREWGIEDEDELQSALSEAATRSYVDILPMLITYAKTSSVYGPQLWLLLEKSIRAGATESLRWLLCNGIAVNDEIENRVTILHEAAGHNHRSLMFFLDRGGVGSIEFRDKFGRTALHHASTSRLPKNVSVLLDHGAEINAMDASGRRPIHLAVMCKDPITVEVLINRGADLTCKDNTGETPLSLAFRRACNEQSERPRAKELPSETRVINMLIEAALKEIVNSPSKGEAPLHLAVKLSTLRFVDRLLVAGADVEAPNMSGMTPLHYTVKFSRWECAPSIAERLINDGADVNARDSSNETVLDTAAKSLDYFDLMYYQDQKSRAKLFHTLQGAGAQCSNPRVQRELERILSLKIF